MKPIHAMLAMLISVPAIAAPFTGPDYSGVYDCTGQDAHEGAYTCIVTMKLDAAQSTCDFGTYSFRLDVPDFGAYHGMAISQGDKLAIYFDLKDPASRDYGVGIATIRKEADGRAGFDKFYYEPEYKGGNTGTESCSKRD